MPVLDYKVGSGLDDCQRYDVTGWDPAFTVISVGYGSSVGYGASGGHASLRFTGVNIPNGAVITVAYVRLRARYGTDPLLAVHVHCEDADNPLAPISAADFDGRSLTSGVTWTFGSWQANQWYDSESIVSEVQAVVDRVGWASGNALQVFIMNFQGESPDPTTLRRMCTYERAAPSAAELHIEYTEAALEVREFSEGIALVDKRISLTSKTYAETALTLADTKILLPTKVLYESVSLGDILSTLTTKVKELLESISLIGVMDTAGSISREFLEVLALGEDFATSAGQLFTKTLNDALSLTDSILKSPHKVFAYTGVSRLTLSETTIKSPAKSLLDSLSLADTITNVKTYARTLSEAVGLADSVLKSVGRVLSQTTGLGIGLTDTTIKSTVKALSDSVSLSDSLIKSTTKALSEAVSLADSISRSATKALTEVLSLGEYFVCHQVIIRFLDMVSTLRAGLTLSSITRTGLKLYSRMRGGGRE